MRLRFSVTGSGVFFSAICAASLRDLGKSVPEDISIIGFDGIEPDRFIVPRLSTVEQPVREIALRSVELLSSMLQENAPPQHIIVEASLITRESLAPLP